MLDNRVIRSLLLAMVILSVVAVTIFGVVSQSHRVDQLVEQQLWEFVGAR